MKYKTILKDSRMEDWVIKNFDQVHFVSDQDLERGYGGDLDQYKAHMQAEIANQLVAHILHSNGIEFLEERDINRQGYLLAGRCKWMVHEE